MLARFRILLPFTIHVRKGDTLQRQTLSHSDYLVYIDPPLRVTIDPKDLEFESPTPPKQVLDRLAPADPQPATEMVLMDEAPTTPANLLQITFSKSDFERSQSEAPPTDSLHDEGDPPATLAFAFANRLLLGLRSVGRAYRIQAISPVATWWRLDYLRDDGTELEPDPAKFRRRFLAPGRVEVSGLNAQVWEKVHSLPPDFVPQPWDTLLLDAQALLPHVGAAVALANSALEVFIDWCLRELAARSPIPKPLWDWINERGHWTQEPSVAEQYDVLLRLFSGRSLKDEGKLWEAFQNLRDARNNLMHEGKAAIGKKHEEVTSAKAAELVARANAIVDWVESLLPGGLRQVRSTDKVTWQFRKLISGPLAPPD